MTIQPSPSPLVPYARRFSIAADHPCLAGHFPGRPLVPGVLLLEQVALALRTWRDERLARVVEAKFIAPLLPGEEAELRLGGGDAPRIGHLRFEIRRGDTLLARGRVETAP